MIVLPPLGDAHEQGFHDLIELQNLLPSRWTLVGGGMVLLLCLERGQAPTRATHDLDAALDVRAHPSIVTDCTRALVQLGYKSAGESPEGHQHRWVKGEAALDILIPSRVGTRAASRKGVTGGTTVETRGAQQALDRSELVEILVGGARGMIPRPGMLGALVAKAAAVENTGDRFKERHLEDFVNLAVLLRPSDAIDRATLRDRRRMRSMIGLLEGRRAIVRRVAGGTEAIEMLREVLA